MAMKMFCDVCDNEIIPADPNSPRVSRGLPCQNVRTEPLRIDTAFNGRDLNLVVNLTTQQHVCENCVKDALLKYLS